MSDPNKLKSVKQLSRPDILFSLARWPNSSRLWLGSSDFNVYHVDLAEDKPQPKPLGGHRSYVTGVALAGEQVITGSYDGRLIWRKAGGGEQVHEATAHSKWIRGVEAAPDGKLVASVADDMVCRLWDAASGKMVRELRGHKEKTPHHYPSMLYACAFSADGGLLATGDKVGHVVVWEVASGKQLATLEAPENYTWDPRQRRHSIGGVRSLAFSPDAKLLAVGGMGKVGNIDHLGGKARVEIFDWRAGKRTHLYGDNKFKGLVEHLAFHHDGDWLVAAGGDHSGFLMFFDLTKKKAIKEEKAPMHVHELALSESSDAIYAAGHGQVVQWKLG